MVNLRYKIYWTLFACTITHSFVHVFTFMHMALIPVFMEEFGLSIFESGLLVSIPLVFSVSISIPFGLLTDRIGYRKLMIMTLLLSGISGLVISQARDFWTLLLPLIFVSSSSTLYHPPALSIVSDLLPQNWRNKALGIHGAGGTSGVAIGPITLGLIMEGFGWRFAYLIWVFPIFLSSLFLLRLPEPSKMSDPKMKQKANSRMENEDHFPRDLIYGYIILILAMTINGIGSQSVSTYMTTYLVSSRGLTKSFASIIYGLSSIVGILGSLSSGYLADRVGSKRWMTLSYLAGVIVLVGVYLGPTSALIIIYLAGGYFGGSTMGPSTSLVAEFSPKEKRGLAYAIFMLPFSVVGAIAPIIAAKIIESHDIPALFPFAISLSFASTLLLQLIQETREPRT